MSTEELQEILVRTMLKQCFLSLILLIISLCTLTFYIIYYMITRSNEGIGIWSFIPILKNRKARYTLKQQIVESICGVLLFGITTVLIAYPMYEDINNQQYEQVITQYSRTNSSSEANWLSNGYVYIELDGENISLNLPYGWTEEEFPLGEFTGSVWYARDSKVILSFDVTE